MHELATEHVKIAASALLTRGYALHASSSEGAKDCIVCLYTCLIIHEPDASALRQVLAILAPKGTGLQE